MIGYRMILLASLISTFVIVDFVFPKMEGAADAHAVETTPGPIGDDIAFAILQDADQFNAAAVGFAGVTPTEVMAWRVIFDRPDAEDEFLRLLDTARPAGQLYALAGLWMRDSRLFAREAARFRGRSDSVRTFSGCIVGTARFDELVAQISRGEWVREFFRARLSAE